ncbi:MAG: hypothetical protein DMG70_23165, partial [Acidobacteria bacterium]
PYLPIFCKHKISAAIGNGRAFCLFHGQKTPKEPIKTDGSRSLPASNGRKSSIAQIRERAPGSPGAPGEGGLTAYPSDV